MMILKRFYDDKLAQASYLVGCAATGEALVVDPNRDAEQYVAAAEAEGLRITYVTETHIHADFVSGARELSERTGARLCLSGEGDEAWSYAFATDAGAVLLSDHDVFRVGNICIEALHTPGHTPEHLSFAVTDTAGADLPMGVFTGDFLFVGDVGRPDLLEKAAKIAGAMEAGARTLFRSLRRFKSELPDFVQIWPGHGAGSACGKSLGAVPQSTIGYEKRFNWGIGIEDEDEFVAAVLSGQPEPPTYFAEMKRINREGPRVLGGLPRPARIAEARLANLIESGEFVIDTRPATSFAAGHVPGTINIPRNRFFTTWAGWLVPYDRDLYLIAVDDEAAAGAARDLALIGLDRIAGYFTERAIVDWKAGGHVLERVSNIAGPALAGELHNGAVNVLDVREPGEWEAGHLPGSQNIHLGHLVDHLDEIPTDKPLVVHCQTGGRSAIAASLLQANGVRNIVNLTGGYGDWLAAGHPVERTAEAERALPV